VSHYCVIPRMQVQAANAMSAYWLINGAPVTAAVAFTHALGRRCDFIEDIEGVGLIHHTVELQGDSNAAGFAPHQRRGSGFIDKSDYVGSTMSLALQPTATRHMVVSLVIKLSDDAFMDDVEILDFLAAARFNGGQVLDHGNVLLVESESELKSKLPSGFWVMDRRDLLSGGVDTTRTIAKLLDANTEYYSDLIQAGLKSEITGVKLDQSDETKITKFIDLLDSDPRIGLKALALTKSLMSEIKSESIQKSLDQLLDENSWLSATTLGYSNISDWDKRKNVRGNYTHGYVESLVGMTQYATTRKSLTNELSNVFWHETWLDDTTYIVQQNY
jgi:CRISPR type I-F-associated protein Csy2